jgi:hypothetical protein
MIFILLSIQTRLRGQFKLTFEVPTMKFLYEIEQQAKLLRLKSEVETLFYQLLTLKQQNESQLSKSTYNDIEPL